MAYAVSDFLTETLRTIDHAALSHGSEDLVEMAPPS